MKNFLKNKVVLTVIASLFVVSLYLVIDNYRGIINITRQQIQLMQDPIPVITYHGFVPEEVKQADADFSSNIWIDDIEGFEEQMKWLHDNGWKTLTAEEFYQWHEKKIELPEKSCLITFDDGYYETYYQALPVMKKYGHKGVCFVIGANTKEHTPAYNPSQRDSIGWDKIKEIESTYPGLSFESHSYDLHGFDESGKEDWIKATAEQLKEDFDKNSQYGFEYYSYPYGGYNEKMLKAVKDANMKMAFTFMKKGYATRNCNKYEVPRLAITAKVSFEQFVRMMEKAE